MFGTRQRQQRNLDIEANGVPGGPEGGILSFGQGSMARGPWLRSGLPTTLEAGEHLPGEQVVATRATADRRASGPRRAFAAYWFAHPAIHLAVLAATPIAVVAAMAAAAPAGIPLLIGLGGLFFGAGPLEAGNPNAAKEPAWNVAQHYAVAQMRRIKEIQTVSVDRGQQALILDVTPSAHPLVRKRIACVHSGIRILTRPTTPPAVERDALSA